MASCSESKSSTEKGSRSSDFSPSTPQIYNSYIAGVNGEADSRSSTHNYSSESSTITHVIQHETLLPSSLKKRSSVKHVRIQEKETEETESLNDKFNSFTEKIQYLEHQKQMLEDRWAHLQEQKISQCNQVDMEPLYQTYISNLLQQVTKINIENSDIQFKLINMMDSVDDFKDKYEDEFNTRIDLEYSFVQLRKDLDSISLDKTHLETQVMELQGTIELMKSIYEEEMKDLKDNINDISVVLEMDSRCTLDFESIVKDVRKRYEAITAKSREEAEALYKSKLDEKAMRARRYGNDLIKSRSDITELNANIQKLRSEILAIQDQSIHLESAVREAKEDDENSTKDAEAKLKEVESALQKARQDMARQVREHQELMNIKLTLDMEIATYKKLLEGEESRMQAPAAAIISVQTGPSRSQQKGRASEWAGRSNSQPQRKNRPKSLVIKAIEQHTQVHSK